MDDMTETGAEMLALELSRFAAHSNTIAYAEMAPLLRKLLLKTGDGGCSPYALLCLLQARPEPEAALLAQRFHAAILSEAFRTARIRQANPKLDWRRSPLLAHLPP